MPHASQGLTGPTVGQRGRGRRHRRPVLRRGQALATGQPLLLEAAVVAAEVAWLRNLQSGHIRAQRRIRQDVEKVPSDADRSEERAGAPEAIADHAARRDPVLISYGGRPLADRAAIAKALAGGGGRGAATGHPPAPGPVVR